MSRIDYIEAKIVTPEVAKRNIGIWKMRGEEIVFTNGCFRYFYTEAMLPI
jgi:hypothetical protein